MKKTQSSLSLRSVTAGAFVSIAALALLVPTAAGQQEPNRPGERKVDEKPIDALTPSIAQIDELVAKAKALLKAGDQAGARAACKEALALAALDRATLEWLAAADGVLWRLGRAAYQAGDLGAAHAAWQAVHRHREASLPDDHPNLQLARGNLAATKKALGDLAGALALQEKVLAVLSATQPDDHPGLQTARGNLAATKRVQGDLAGALALQEKVLAVRLATLPDDHHDLQVARGNLANTKKELGDLPGALALEEKVLAVFSATLPDDQPDLQTARGNLAGTKKALGDLSAAAQLQRAAVAGALRRLSTQTASLRDIVQLARQATAPLSHVASLLDLGTAVPAEIAAPLRVDGLHLLEATRSAPLHLARLQQFIRTQHPDASARLLPQLAAANRHIDEAAALPAEGRRSPDGKQISCSDAIREAALAKDTLEHEWLALIPPNARTAPDAATLANALAQGEVAISFCTYARETNDPEKPWVETSQQRYGAFLLTSSGDVTWHSLAATAKVDALIAEIRKLAIDGRPDATVTPRLTELSALLLDPVLAALPPGTKSVVLSLADEMHLLPLDDLPLASGKLFGEAFSVRLAWSLRARAPASATKSPRGSECTRGGWSRLRCKAIECGANAARGGNADRRTACTGRSARRGGLRHKGAWRLRTEDVQGAVPHEARSREAGDDLQGVVRGPDPADVAGGSSQRGCCGRRSTRQDLPSPRNARLLCAGVGVESRRSARGEPAGPLRRRPPRPRRPALAVFPHRHRPDRCQPARGRTRPPRGHPHRAGDRPPGPERLLPHHPLGV